MELMRLDLAKASLLKREVDTICLLFEKDISSNQTTKSEKSKFISTLNQRIDELDDFYVHNSSDERAALFETQRLRLRKLVIAYNQQQSVAAENQRVVSSSKSFASVEPIVVSHTTPRKTPRSVTKTFGSGSSTQMTYQGSRETYTSSSPRKKIYDWEQEENNPARQEAERGMLNIDGVWFKPAKYDGFYCREDYDERNALSTFVDLQIVLTQDELTVLAARKRAVKADLKNEKNSASATSVISSTPYIEPSRVQKEMLRPGGR